MAILGFPQCVESLEGNEVREIRQCCRELSRVPWMTDAIFGKMCINWFHGANRSKVWRKLRRLCWLREKELE